MKSILVPGGAGALGSAVVDALIARDFHVILPKKTSRTAIASQPHVTTIDADATDERDVDRIYETIEKNDWNLFGLVHLLGGIRSFSPIADSSVEDWDALMNLNLRSFYLFARRAMKVFTRNQAGRIVSIASMAAAKPAAKQAAYGVAKAGVVALTKILADEGRAIGVTANAIAPSVIDTPANREWGSPEEITTWVTPQEIASMIVSFISDESRSINGSVIQMFGKMNV